MSVFTLELPNEIADLVAALPEECRADWLARVHAFAVAQAREEKQGSPLEQEGAPLSELLAGRIGKYSSKRSDAKTTHGEDPISGSLSERTGERFAAAMVAKRGAGNL